MSNISAEARMEKKKKNAPLRIKEVLMKVLVGFDINGSSANVWVLAAL